MKFCICICGSKLVRFKQTLNFYRAARFQTLV
jgi:hypothetical protein